ncbi:MAG: aminotransferase class V-fold PLP-dependent enzyme [Clostridia bacterium]|nr:aminotransferase class V-fold PLP-dependent enzyme [Clostridia bacterium]
MKTPICDFVRRYSELDSLRLHMPGHKGKNILGVESLDITEIDGADSLYEADGIIKESELNASKLFGFKSLYSTEGSSQCIRAMLYLTVLHAKNKNSKPLILAGRNAHKTFLSAAALLDFDIDWIYPKNNESYLSCIVDAKRLDLILNNYTEKPIAVYLTNPDYLGNFIDIESIAAVCHKHGLILVVDNAHGAYLKFLRNSLHPIDLGADICCDSAHKTLPVLTGGAYLHISDNAPEIFLQQAKNALALFGSTSPSYILMQSLDAANKYLSEGYNEKLNVFISHISDLKNELISFGYSFIGNEPLKLTFDIKKYGYTGYEFADILKYNNIFCEFADPDYIVLMFTPETEDFHINILKETLFKIPKKGALLSNAPDFKAAIKKMSVREAFFSPCETIPVEESIGRILAVSNTCCPPAVPIIISGECIDSHAVECLKYYGINECSVIK